MCLYAVRWILCETKLICCCLPEKERGGRPQTGWRSFWTAPKWWMLIKLVKLLWWVFQANTKSRRNIQILRGWISPTSMSLEVNCWHLNIHFIPKILYFASDTWYFDAGLNSKPGCVESKISWDQVPMSRNSTRKLFMK